MLEKIKNALERRSINQTQFIAFIFTVATLMLAALVLVPFEHTIRTEGGATLVVRQPLTSFGNLLIAYGEILQGVSALLAVGFGITFFLEGIGFKVWATIRKNPIALAVAVGSIFVSLAVVIRG